MTTTTSPIPRRTHSEGGDDRSLYFYTYLWPALNFLSQNTTDNTFFFFCFITHTYIYDIVLLLMMVPTHIIVFYLVDFGKIYLN